jgi:hypothetical protein
MGAGQQPGEASAVREVIARAKATLAAPSARIEFRIDTDVIRAEQQEQRHPGPVGRLVRLAARATLERVAPGWDSARLRDAFEHQLGAGFIEPAAGRYQVDFGGYAEMYMDGSWFGGLSGQPLQPRHQGHLGRKQLYDPLGMLAMLQQVTDAQHAGSETVRGTPCRKVAVWLSDAELTVWIDNEHIRRIQAEGRASDAHLSVSKRQALELWDFGAADDSLDWLHLPSFRTPSPDPALLRRKPGSSQGWPRRSALSARHLRSSWIERRPRIAAGTRSFAAGCTATGSSGCAPQLLPGRFHRFARQPERREGPDSEVRPDPGSRPYA